MTQISKKTAIKMLAERKSVFRGVLDFSEIRIQEIAKCIDEQPFVSNGYCERSVVRVSGYRVQFSDECWLTLDNSFGDTRTYIHAEHIIVEHVWQNDLGLHTRYLLYALV